MICVKVRKEKKTRLDAEILNTLKTFKNMELKL
jgi:hypothetical protein